MREIATILMVMLFGVTAQAQVNFEKGSYSDALKKASAEGKMIFMDCYTDWCIPCKILDRFVFKSVVGGEYFNKKFINFQIDMEKGEGVELQKKFKVGVFPTLMLINSDGTEHNRLTGATNNPAEFIARVEEAAKKENGAVYRAELYEKDKSKANEYFSFLLSRGESKKAEPIIIETFKLRTPAENYSNESYEVYNKAVNDIFSPLFYEIILDEKNASDILGKEKFNEFVAKKVTSTFSSLLGGVLSGSMNFDNERIKKAISLMEQFPLLNNNVMKFFFAAEKPIVSKNGDELSSLTLEYIEKGNKADEDALQGVMSIFSYYNKNYEAAVKFYEKLATITKDEANRTKYIKTVDAYKKKLEPSK